MQRAIKADFEPFNASDWKIGIVVAQFNKHITDQLLESALARAEEYSISEDNVVVAPVAGSIEIPLVLQTMAASGSYRALLAIGCVIQGDTPHFEYVCKFITEGILRTQLDHHMPIGFGVLTTNTEAQALERAGLGGEHLDAALQQAKVIANL